MITSSHVGRFAKKVVAVVEPHLVSFVLTLGIDEVYEIRDGEDFAKYIRELCSRDDVAILVTQRSLFERYGVVQERVKVYPVVVSLPDRPEDLRTEAIDVYRELIRKFIGYEIHIGL